MSHYDLISDHSIQPLSTFVEVYVAGHLVKSVYSGSRKGQSRAPEYIQSFEFTRIETTGNFVLTMFDKNWTELETIFNLGNQAVTIRYGYVGGKQSAVLDCLVSNYNIKFKTSGVILTVRGLVRSIVDNMTLMTLDTETTNPTEAAKAICKYAGYKIGKFEETKDIDLGGNQSFVILKEHPLTYINEKIAPMAIGKSTGMSGYKLYIDYGTTPPTASFLNIMYQSSNSVKSYVYAKGINTSVISLDVDVTGVFGGTSASNTTTSAQSSSIDPATEDVSDISGTTSSNSPKTTPNGDPAYTNTPPTQENILSTDGLTPEMSEAAVQNVLSLSGSVPYKGSITILGDPTLVIGDSIDIVVLTSTGDVYDVISGQYYVTGVSDTIEGGKFTTTLSIVKKISAAGTTSIQSSPQSESSSPSGGSTSDSQVSPEINKKITKARVRILVPKGSSIGHYELQIPGDVVFKGQKFDRPVFSYSSDGTLVVCPLSKDDSRYSNQSYTAYYIEFDCHDKFPALVETLESYVNKEKSRSNGYTKYSLKGSYANYDIERRNCFTALAAWCKFLGNDTLSKIVSSSNTYRDYLPKVMYQKYGKYWTKY